MNPEEYWKQTRGKWEKRAINPLGSTKGCGFCRFIGFGTCRACPVVKVYGGNCETVEPVNAFYSANRVMYPNVEKLSTLAEAIVQELDDKKDELIAAMYEILKL